MKYIQIPSKAVLMLLILVGFLQGCASTASMSGYIKPEHPYKHVVYGEFEEVLTAVKDVLRDEGWQINKETHPSLYERSPNFNREDADHVLIFTNTKHATRIVYSKDTQLNVYISRAAEGVELDVRYGRVTNFYIKKVYRYRNDKKVKQFFNRVEQRLLTK